MKKIFIPIAIAIFLLINFSFSKTFSDQNILSVQNIMTGGGSPCSFNFTFSKGDRISISTSKLDGKFENFNILIHDLERNSEEVIKEQFLSDYLISSDGTYIIEFRNKKKVYLDININVKPIKNKAAPLYLKKGNFHVGITKGRKGKRDDKPTFLFSNLEEGDKITISCNDSNGAINVLRCNHIEQDNEYGLNTGAEYIIPQTGQISLKFHLDEENQGLLQKILKGRKDLFFENVNFTYTPKPEIYSPITAIVEEEKEETPEVDQFGNYIQLQSDMEIERLLIEEAEKKRLAELMAANGESTEAMMKGILNALGVSYDTIQNAVFDSPAILYDPTTALADYVTIPPQKDLINGNKKCFLLNGVVENDIWFFWFGTGSNAKEVFEKKMDQNERSSGKGITSIYSRAFKNRKVISEVSFPNKREFTENIEYALVDGYNKTLFEKGENYNPYYPGYKSFSTKTEFSIFPHIKNPEKDTADELYSCFCNHNKYSPMNLYFKYYVGTIEEEEKMRRNAPSPM